jgi:hypothetical protein
LIHVHGFSDEEAKACLAGQGSEEGKRKMDPERGSRN